LDFFSKNENVHRIAKIALALLVLVPLGFSTKFYHGPFCDWVNNGAGDILYPIFWFLLLLLFFPKMSVRRAAWFVFFFSSFIEISQLFHPLWLETWRRNFVLRTIFGSGFEWIDFFYYAVGSVLAFFLAKWLRLTRN
jgi:hypothetical protein